MTVFRVVLRTTSSVLLHFAIFLHSHHNITTHQLLGLCVFRYKPSTKESPLCSCVCVCVCVCVLSCLSCTRLFATLWTLAHPRGSSVYTILQVRILEWVAMPFSRGSIFLAQGSNPSLLCLLLQKAGSLPLVPPRKPTPHNAPSATLPLTQKKKDQLGTDSCSSPYLRWIMYSTLNTHINSISVAWRLDMLTDLSQLGATPRVKNGFKSIQNTCCEF